MTGYALFVLFLVLGILFVGGIFMARMFLRERRDLRQARANLALAVVRDAR